MKAFLLGVYLVISLTKINASSLRDLCDEFVKNGTSSPATITFNLTDANITKTFQTVVNLQEWCEEIFKTSYVSLTSLPTLSINDPSWQNSWGAPMIVSGIIGIATIVIAGRQLKAEWRKEDKRTITNRLHNLENRINILEQRAAPTEGSSST